VIARPQLFQTQMKAGRRPINLNGSIALFAYWSKESGIAAKAHPAEV
jgi:hypothetical protein